MPTCDGHFSMLDGHQCLSGVGCADKPFGWMLLMVIMVGDAVKFSYRVPTFFPYNTKHNLPNPHCGYSFSIERMTQ